MSDAKDNTGKFVWYEYIGHDLAAASDFYSKVVGWNIKTADMGGGFDYRIASIGDYGVAGLMNIPDDAKAMGAPPCWTGYIWVPDVDAAVPTLKAAGGKLQKGPMDIPGVGRFAVVSDPYGAMFMLFRDAGGNPPPEPAADTPGRVGWRQLSAGDGAGAFAFYSGLFGWKKESEFDMGAMGIYHIFNTGHESGGMMTAPAQAPGGPHWLYFFNVEAIDAGDRRITANGGKVVNGPHQVPTGQWIVEAVDPQGAIFALLAPIR